jgi:hypothetical protein
MHAYERWAYDHTAKLRESCPCLQLVCFQKWDYAGEVVCEWQSDTGFRVSTVTGWKYRDLWLESLDAI